MKTKLTYLFVLCLLVCIALPAVLLSNPTSSTSGQLTDWQGIRDKVLLHAASFDWIKWTLAIGLPALLTVLGVCFAALFFAIRDTRQETQQGIQKLDSRIDKLESNTRQDMQRLESGIQENRKLLIELIQKQSPTNTGPARYKAASPQARRQAKR